MPFRAAGPCRHSRQLGAKNSSARIRCLIFWTLSRGTKGSGTQQCILICHKKSYFWDRTLRGISGRGAASGQKRCASNQSTYDRVYFFEQVSNPVRLLYKFDCGFGVEHMHQILLVIPGAEYHRQVVAKPA